MSAHNFWNSFSFGFLNGMFNNNPFFGCGMGWNFFGFNNMSYPNCLFMVPNVMCSMNNFFPLLPNINMPIFQQPLTTLMNGYYNNFIDEMNIDTFKKTSDKTKIEDETRTQTRPIKNNTQPSPDKEPVRNNKPEIITNTSCNINANNLKTKWNKINPSLSIEFYQKVIKISKNINCNPDDLMALMNSESSLKHNIKNSIGAVGLIQFLPKTAKELGTNSQELQTMSPERQLDYVEKYFIKNKQMAGFGATQKLDSGSLYALCFLPARAKNAILCRKGEKYYSHNQGLDINKDGMITKIDLVHRLDQKRA